MQFFARLFGLGLIVLWSNFSFPSSALAQPLIQQMAGFSLSSPTDPVKPSTLEPYSQTDGNLRWSVGAWNIPGGKMPPFSKQQSGDKTVFFTHAQAAGVNVAFDSTGTTLTLEQDGSVVPCKDKNNNPFEFDLFAAPNAPNVKSPRLSGYSWSDSHGPALSGLTGLEFDANVVMTQGLATSRKQCKANFGNMVVAVILNDRSTHPAQVFFYQFFFSRLCGSNPSVKLTSCRPPKNMFQFFLKNPFGTDDYSPLAGMPWLVQGQPTKIQINLLPRIVNALKTAHGGLDQNLSHWTVGSMYLGQIIYGDVTLQSTWRDVSLIAKTSSN
jgi:hypothetical protein